MENIQETENLYLKKELSKFNWGAFGLGIIWAAFNGAVKNYIIPFIIAIVCFFLSYIPLIGGIFGLTTWLFIPIYAGINGNKWAWYGKEWKGVEDFNNTQKKWARATTICIILYLIIWLLMIAGAAFFGFKLIKEKGGLEKMLNTLYVKTLVEDSNWKNLNSGEDIVDKLINLDPKTKKYNSNTVVTKTDKGYEIYMTFYKNGDCNLKEHNCYITMYSPNGISGKVAVMTYFGNNAKVKHVVLEDFVEPIPDYDYSEE